MLLCLEQKWADFIYVHLFYIALACEILDQAWARFQWQAAQSCRVFSTSTLNCSHLFICHRPHVIRRFLHVTPHQTAVLLPWMVSQSSLHQAVIASLPPEHHPRWFNFLRILFVPLSGNTESLTLSFYPKCHLFAISVSLMTSQIWWRSSHDIY